MLKKVDKRKKFLASSLRLGVWWLVGDTGYRVAGGAYLNCAFIGLGWGDMVATYWGLQLQLKSKAAAICYTQSSVLRNGNLRNH